MHITLNLNIDAWLYEILTKLINESVSCFCSVQKYSSIITNKLVWISCCESR